MISARSGTWYRVESIGNIHLVSAQNLQSILSVSSPVATSSLFRGMRHLYQNLCVSINSCVSLADDLARILIKLGERRDHYCVTIALCECDKMYSLVFTLSDPLNLQLGRSNGRFFFFDSASSFAAGFLNMRFSFCSRPWPTGLLLGIKLSPHCR